MEMLLTIACISLFGFGIMAAAFKAAGSHEPPAPPPEPRQENAVPLPPARFFADYSIDPKVTRMEVPVEALLLQIENHVRLEHAAAESFLVAPSPELLHSKTTSKFIQ